MDKIVKILPCALIAIDILAACMYAFNGDYRRFIYWLSAASLTACVTF